MKKTIVIILLVVYIASIAVVNFFGLEVKIFDGVTYVQGIQCNSITVQNETPVTVESKQMLGEKPLFVFDFVPADEDNPYTADAESIINNPNAVQINYEVLPHLANETSVKFEYDEQTNEGAVVFHELSRTFVFLKPNRAITVTIRATDGSNVSTQIVLMGRIPKDSNS
jgi:hypothetical protein